MRTVINPEAEELMTELHNQFRTGGILTFSSFTVVSGILVLTENTTTGRITAAVVAGMAAAATIGVAALVKPLVRKNNTN